jgi:hypothetical protein
VRRTFRLVAPDIPDEALSVLATDERLDGVADCRSGRGGEDSSRCRANHDRLGKGI